MRVSFLDKLGSIGTVVVGTMMPCCFPFIAVATSVVGFRALARWESHLLWVMQFMVVVALIGSFIAYRGHRKILPLALGVLSSAAILYPLNTDLDTDFIYAGMVGLMVVAVWNTIETKRCKAPR
jgi:hypothetical protein